MEATKREVVRWCASFIVDVYKRQALMFTYLRLEQTIFGIIIEDNGDDDDDNSKN